jgi:uncharacterized protein (DUF934 family)
MPRRLLLNGKIAVDEWRSSGEAGDATGDAADSHPLLLTLAEWRTEEERWRSRRGPLGVLLNPADPVESLAPDLGRLALIAAEFPGPSEGRGYTQGRLLRERYRFAGELRARGHIGIDHVFFLARCGFNSLELPESDLERGALALATFSYAYQRSNDRGLSTPLARRA